MIRSLRLRLAIGAIVAIVVSLLMVWVGLGQLFTDYVVDRYRTEMTVLADSIAAGIAIKDGKLTISPRPSDPRLKLPAGGRYWQVDAIGRASERSRSLWDTAIDPNGLGPAVFGSFRSYSGPDGAEIYVAEQKSSLGEGPDALSFTVYTAFPKSELEDALSSFHGELRRMLFLTACVLIIAAIIQAAVGLAPLRRLAKTVGEVRAGRLSSLGDDGPREVQPLIGEINLLLHERETAIERARSRASDLAHGLKTPLTVLAQLATRMDPQSADLALRQIDAVRQRADRQLQAARLGVERMASTDVGALTGKLVAVLRPVTDPAGIDWQVEMSGDLVVAADPADLAEAIGNILDNATKWARSAIAVSVSREGEDVLVVIGDDGPGVAEADIARIFERGVHDEGVSGGSGLGLSIARDIAEAYGASLTFGRSAFGGAEVRIVFPSRPSRTPTVKPV
jgi:signal transduction histidine kinase